jgi:transcriptional regulator
MSLLPPVHARVLELDDKGLGARAIAAQLDTEPEAVASLLKVARAKLAVLERRGEPVIPDE